MDNDQSLEEYVLSQDGIIFRGSYKHPISTPWNFGQVPTPTLMLSTSPNLLSTRRALCQSGLITLVLITENIHLASDLLWFI